MRCGMFNITINIDSVVGMMWKKCILIMCVVKAKIITIAIKIIEGQGII